MIMMVLLVYKLLCKECMPDVRNNATINAKENGRIFRLALLSGAGLPTVDHLEVYSTTPTWTFVSDYKEKKTKARTK